MVLRQIIGSFTIFTFWLFLWMILTALVVYFYILPKNRIKHEDADVVRDAVIRKSLKG